MTRVVTTCAVAVFGVVAWNTWHTSHEDRAQTVRVFVTRDGVTVPYYVAENATVGEVLGSLNDGDRVIPDSDTRVVPEMAITVVPMSTITVVVERHPDQETHDCVTSARTARAAIESCNISGTLVGDITDNMPVRSGMTLTVAQESVHTETRTQLLPYTTVTREDPSQPFGKRTIVQAGKNGRVRITETVTYRGTEEIERTEVERTIVTPPQDEIVAIGTKVKLGKKHTGQASWYAYKGCDCAANPWLPKGSYVKVTNRANGKSVIVRINDRGPFVPGRIIDLDAVAFKKIASLGAGVIDVIMEEIRQ